VEKWSDPDVGTVVLTVLVVISRDQAAAAPGVGLGGVLARQFRLISSGLSLVAERLGVNAVRDQASRWNLPGKGALR